MHLRGIVTCRFSFLLLTNLFRCNQHKPSKTACALCVVKYSARLRKSMPVSFQLILNCARLKGCNQEAHPRTYVFTAEKKQRRSSIRYVFTKKFVWCRRNHAGRWNGRLRSGNADSISVDSGWYSPARTRRADGKTS